MTLQEFTHENRFDLMEQFKNGECEDYANFTSFCFVKWHESGEVSYE